MKQNREIPQLTDEELDKVADTAIEYIKKIISKFELGEIIINEYEGSDRELILDITGDNLSILIGSHGQTLDALQQLITTILSYNLEYYYPVIIDVEGYKSRQRIKIEKNAKKLAEKVWRSKKPYHMRPMNPYKRRIVHSILAGDSRVETQSENEGIKRHLVIYPKN